MLTILIFLGILVVVTAIVALITIFVFEKYENKIKVIFDDTNQATIYFLLICLSISLTYIYMTNFLN